jgi:hypothetical protein
MTSKERFLSVLDGQTPDRLPVTTHWVTGYFLETQMGGKDFWLVTETAQKVVGELKALRAVLREDPDVILIGEMRDQETIQAALTLAETGHLTFGTLHTSDCVQTINRIVDVFPAHQQQQIRTQLSFTLEGVFCQQLLPKIN